MDQITFGPLLPFQKSTIETTWMEYPSMLKIAHAWQISSGVPLHCTFLKSIVQAYHQVQANVEAIPYIEGARSVGISLSIVQAYHQVQASVETIPYIEGAKSGGISLKCKILVPP